MKMRNVENAKLKKSDYDPLISESDGDYTIMSETKIKDFRYKRNRFPVSFAFTHLFKANEKTSHGDIPSAWIRGSTHVSLEG